MPGKQHCENVYSTKTEHEVNWFQPYPKTSMEFTALFDLPLSANILVVGGGDSYFVDALLEKGYLNIWVLDLSANAIDSAKKRLGDKALWVHWIISDITGFKPPVQFDFWHDRAAFHFLTSEDRINEYVSIAEDAIKQNGFLILGTFSENDPNISSALEIKLYTKASMSARFKIRFNRIIKFVEGNHTTPSYSFQDFFFLQLQ